ncbi:MAG TPA: flavin reductase family protein [Myxococcota bacterium]|nr:flavin reductase family protein [Myxococcota bacterium]
MHIEATSLDKKATYFLMTSVLVPRPIAWVGTRCPEGVDNLAPFSYFMGVSSDPPLVAVSIARGRGGALKDTCTNLLQTEVCTVNIVSAPLLQLMHDSSAPHPPEVSEFEALGIESVEAGNGAPGVAAARVRLDCRVYSAQDLGSTHLFLLEITAYELDDSLVVDGRVRAADLAPVARLGGSYSLLGEEIVLPRPSV